MYAEYKVPQLPRLGLTANVNYNSSSPLLPINGFNIGSYTLVDLGGFYNHPVRDLDVTYRLMLNNAFDTNYLSPYSSYSSGFNVGRPRTLMASFTVGFGGSSR